VCYDDQTEVLTQKGWVNFALLRKGDSVATVNMASHKMEWQTPSAYIEQWYEGPMVLSEPDEQGANFCVTPNHRMVIANRKSGKWRLHAADLLKQVGDSAIPTGWNPRDVIDGDERVWRERVNRMGRKSTLDAKRVDFARFLGLWLSEGCLSEQTVKSINQTRRYVRIAQKHDPDAVRAILSTLGVTWQETTGKNGVIDFRIQHAALFDELNELCGKVLSADKRIPAAVWEWGVDSLYALLDGLMLGDGRHRTHDESGKRIATDAYYTTSKSLADDVQTLACHLGAPSVISSQRRTTPYAPNGVTVHIVRFHRARQAKIDKLPLKAVPYAGFVRCVTVPNGTLIVRRGGRPMVCGNCQWWAIDPDGRMYMYREIYKTQTLVEDHAARIKDLSAGERYQYTVADHDAEDRATLARHGIATVAANKKVLAGIQAVSERLTPAGDGKPRLFLFRNALVDRDMNLEAGKQPVRTEDEFGGYVWNDKVRKEEPVKQDDHGCLVADTLVLTARGNVRITDVHIGDLVMTRAGWRRVVDVGMTAEAAKVLTVFLSDGSILTGTGNHPVYVRGSGYSRLDALRYGDIIMRTENITGAIPCLSGAQLLRKSNLTGSSIGVILNRSNGQIGCTSRPDTWIGNAASSDCIKRFGKRLTGLFLSAMRFIMLTATRLTTIRATSIVSLAPSTSIFTENVSAMNAWNSCATQWITRENTRVYGTDLTQVAHGTQNMVAQRGRIESRLNTHVNNAEENTKRWPRAGKGAFARTNAKPRIGAQAELTMRTARVSDAVRCSGSTDIQNNDIAAVHVVAVVTNAKPSAVYNLTVEGMHEYFANGILVHNCDAARYAVMAVNSRVAPQLAANPFYGHGG